MKPLEAMLTVVCLLAGAAASMSAADGRIAYVRYDTYKLMVFDTATQRSHQVPLPASVVAFNAAWSPNGEWIVFDDGQDSEVYAVRPDGSGHHRISDGTGVCADPAVSKDGMRVAYQEVYGNVFVINFDGSNKTNLGYGIDMVDWSTCGTKLAGCDWALGGGYHSDLWIWDLATGSKTRITHRPAGTAYQRPRWSPDGSKIVAGFVQNDNFYDVVVMNPDGSEIANVTSDWTSNEANPSWTPDGQYILFVSDHDGSSGIWAMRPDGSDKTKLVSGGGAHLASPSMAMPLYSEDFSCNPGWNTDDPAKLRWDSAAGVFHGTQVNTEGTSACINLPGFNPNGYWRLEWDHRINSDQWSAGLTIGLFDASLSYGHGAGADISIADGGNFTAMFSPSGSPSSNSPSWSAGTWYRNVLEYNAGSNLLALTVTVRSNGADFMKLTTTTPSLPTDTTRLGVSRLHMKNTGPGASPSATVDYNLDNIRLYGEAAPMLAFPLANTTVAPGSTAQFAVKAFGTQPLTYEWFFNGAPLPANGPTLTVPDVSPEKAGTYCVVVRNAFGSVTNCAYMSALDLRMFAGLILSGPVGTTYKVECLDAIGGGENWQPLTNITLSTSPMACIDMDSVNHPRRFYRAMPMP